VVEMRVSCAAKRELGSSRMRASDLRMMVGVGAVCVVHVLEKLLERCYRNGFLKKSPSGSPPLIVRRCSRCRVLIWRSPHARPA